MTSAGGVGGGGGGGWYGVAGEPADRWETASVLAAGDGGRSVTYIKTNGYQW